MNHILIESPTFMWLFLMKEKLMDEIFITHTQHLSEVH